MPKQMQTEEEMFSVNKNYQGNNLKIGVQKNFWKWRENVSADICPIYNLSDRHFLPVW